MFPRDFYDPSNSGSVHEADAVDWLREILPESMHLAVTDPAYESLEKHRAKGTTTRLSQSKASSNEWFPIFHNDRLEELYFELHRVLVPDAHCYVLCDWETMLFSVPLLKSVGFHVWKAIIWDKVTIGMGYHYRARHEYVLFAEKGKRRLVDLGMPDVLAVPRVRGGYPTEKPVGLLSRLIYQSSKPGEIVIDPFTGSGSTAEAALASGCSFRGCDVKTSAVEWAEARITGVVQALTAPGMVIPKGVPWA